MSFFHKTLEDAKTEIEAGNFTKAKTILEEHLGDPRADKVVYNIQSIFSGF